MAEQAQNALEMSDEDFLKSAAPDFSGVTVEDAATDETPEAEENAAEAADAAPVTSDAVTPEAEAKDDAADEGAASAASEDGAESEAEAATDEKVDAKAENDSADEKKLTEKPSSDEKPDEKPVEIDYKAEYERLLAPFKANGREIQVKSVDDAIALMQMGANYNKKMAGLKPNLKMLKLLENNGLLNEEKLSFLIELDKKNPDAINKLVKDSGLDPMGFDAEKAGTYQPKIHTVDDREVELDSVLDDLQSSPSYSRTLSIVSKEWDGASKQVIANTPQLLRVINDHVERGIYDIISKEVESERMLGRLAGLSDIEAYRQVGDAINARGGFNHLGTPQGKSATAAEIVTPKPKKTDDSKLNEKRRAAAPTKPVAPTAVAQDFNPLALSDEEFAKMAAPRFA